MTTPRTLAQCAVTFLLAYALTWGQDLFEWSSR